MKYFFSILLLLMLFSASAQEAYIDGTGFDSVFQHQKEGKHEGVVIGQLSYIQNYKSEIIEFDNTGVLNIIPDKDEVYDISIKQYETQKNNVRIAYSTYNYANSFEITIEDKKYIISTIDGGTDLAIANLKWVYKANDTSEKLFLFFTKNIELRLSDKHSGSKLKVRAGSWISWKMERD